MLNEATTQAVARHPRVLQPKTFTEQLKDFAVGADELMSQLNEKNELLRVSDAENSVLRARNADLDQHIEEQKQYWETRVAELEAENARISRRYHSLSSRLDGVVDFIVGTRDAEKRESFAPDIGAERVRVAGQDVVVREKRPGEDTIEEELRVLLGNTGLGQPSAPEQK